jgi:predicted nucleotidyltransferase
LSAALFGRVRRAVLALMFLHPAESFYVREVVRATDVGQGAVQRELKNLASAGILQRERRGQQVHYQADPDCPVYEELRALMVKTAGLADVLRDALSSVAGDIDVAFVFGSMATGDIDAGSDVDVMIVGDVGFGQVVSELQEAQQQLGREVNPTVYPSEEFCAKLAGGHQFLSRVMEDPRVFLVGSERDLRAMAE